MMLTDFQVKSLSYFLILKNGENGRSSKTLQEAIDSDLIPLEEKNIFRINIMSPLTFHLGLYSDLPFKLMSMSDYLSRSHSCLF